MVRLLLVSAVVTAVTVVAVMVITTPRAPGKRAAPAVAPAATPASAAHRAARTHAAGNAALAEPTRKTGLAPKVEPTQKLVVLYGLHEAFSRPSRRSKPLRAVPALRPITGERTTLPVVGRHGRAWFHVRLPGRPNGLTGWIMSWGTATTTTSWHIVVDTAARRVAVYRHGRRVRTFPAVVGKPATPTPHGKFFVEESVELGKQGVGGPVALALSARSTVLRWFDGGPGQVAVHGLWNIGGVPGTAVSHGCIRLRAAAVRWLAHRVGPGVPVTIH